MQKQNIFSRDELKHHGAGMAALFPPLEYEDTAYIPLDGAKNFIVEALEAFNPQAGQRASTILYDEQRLDINEDVARGDLKTMYCAPAGFENNERAIIHLDYDGSVKGGVLLAHELGHAIADDCGLENGKTLLNNPPHMWEVQAYMVQHIVTEALRGNDVQMAARAARKQLGHAYQSMDAIARLGGVAQDVLASADNVQTDKIMTRHFGADWYKQMSGGDNLHHRRILLKTYEDISILAEGERHPNYGRALENIGEYNERIFDRPAAFYAGVALASCAGNHKGAVFDAVMGARGYCNLPQCLNVAGLNASNVLIDRDNHVKSSRGVARKTLL